MLKEVNVVCDGAGSLPAPPPTVYCKGQGVRRMRGEVYYRLEWLEKKIREEKFGSVKRIGKENFFFLQVLPPSLLCSLPQASFLMKD